MVARRIRIGATEDAATTAWVSAVVSAGGAVSATQRSRVDTLIVALKGHSLFSANSRLWLFGGESDAKQATIDLMNLSTATPQNSPTLAAGGYTGNGSTQYIDLGTRPSNYTQFSASYGAYNRRDDTGTGDDLVAMGCYDSGGGGTIIADLTPKLGGGSALGRINTAPSGTPAGANVNHKGLYIVTTTADTVQVLYKNGSSLATGSQSNVVLTTLPTNFFALARNDIGTPTNHYPGQLAAVFILGGCDATQAANLSTDLNAYMTAWGINVY